MFRVPNHHIAQYLSDVLGVQDVVLPEAAARPVSTKGESLAKVDGRAPVKTEVPSRSPYQLWVVAARPLTDAENDLLSKMLAAIGSPSYQLVHDVGLAGRPALVLGGSDPRDLATKSDPEIFATHSITDLLTGGPEDVRQRKSEAWQVLKHLKRSLGERS